MNLDAEIAAVEANCLADKQFYYLTNFASDHDEDNPKIWCQIIPAACRLYSSFSLADGRRAKLLDILDRAKEADPDVDVSAPLKLLMADLEAPSEASDGEATWQDYSFVVSMAHFALGHLKNEALHDSLISKAIELADSPWGKHGGINNLLESSKISSAQADKLLELAKKYLKGAEQKTLIKIVERRRKYLEIS
jgi:hypothetical protein